MHDTFEPFAHLGALKISSHNKEENLNPQNQILPIIRLQNPKNRIQSLIQAMITKIKMIRKTSSKIRGKTI
jgi:hypothetical protein